MVPKPASDTRVALARLAIIVTVCSWLAYTVLWCFNDFFHPGYESAVSRTEEVLYLVIVTALTVSALAYLLTRLGFMYRTRTHHRATRASLDQYFDARRPTLTTIIPSYQEEERVIRMTLLSAALQEYPDYVVTLDADSVLLPEYCLRLVHLLEQHEYQDMAIAQTPYSAFPGSATRLERIAGATTDLQHIVHEGLTYYDATFWVGANAVIRKKALDQIAETSYLGDWEIKQYIKDRTVIEGTESTIDMGIHGWRLFNYPERLSYSATPPDFGSLCIQRRRWANGGLLILSKLHRQSRARRAEGRRTRFSELFLRWNYMASISWSSASLLILLAFPFSATLISPLLGLIALPYFLAMAGDLRYCGYKRLDVLRIYGFNLVLLGVNLAGTFSSIVQGITASKAPFARTPKVKDRTVVPAFLLIAPYLLIALAGFTFYRAYEHHLAENACYAALNVILACYAAKSFIGLRNSLADLWIHGTALLFKSGDRRTRWRGLWRRPAEAPPATDWRSVLQAGYAEPQYQAAGPRPACRRWPRRRRPRRCPTARRGGGCRWPASWSPWSCWRVRVTAVTWVLRHGCWSLPPRCTRPGSRPTWTSRSRPPTSSRTPRPTRPGRPCSASWSPRPSRTAPRAGAAPTPCPRPTSSSRWVPASPICSRTGSRRSRRSAARRTPAWTSPARPPRP
jgi:cellulose synthase/poly-beta-1,6-N-acetylglucosamine synthase-like glycosyltransferase